MEQIGRYKISGELGRGAMGVVYAATDPLIGRPVAIKTICLSGLSDNRAELTRRLYREAQSAGILSHPGIITIHDIGEEGENAFIVMELVDGKSLEGLLTSGVTQNSSTLLMVLRKTAVALDYAHGKGIIHRDIKPSNIMICNDGEVKIADFGVAKLSASASMTQSGMVLGTPSYMSPEQAQGRTIDGRSDQFSLAVVAYRMLTGKLPFEASTLTALLTKILWEDPDYEGAGLRPPLLPVFQKALSKDPRLRFATCADFVQQLEETYAQHRDQLLSRMPESAPAPEATPAPAEIPVPAGAAATAHEDAPDISSHSCSEPASGAGKSTSQLPPSSQTAPAEAPRRKGTMLIVLAAGLGIVVLALIAFLAFRMIEKPEASVQALSSGEAPVREIEPPAADPVPPEEVRESSPATPVSLPAQAAPAPAKPETAAPSGQPDSLPAVPAPNRVKAPAKSYPRSGTIAWSGELQKNTVLVIGEQQATIGSITGGLPGTPVQIEVEPKEVIVRQMPGEENGWNLIILYSGNAKFTSIRIHWKTIN